MSDQAKKEALFEMVKRFVADRRITCPETIYQRDSLVEDASEFMERCVEIVGYQSAGDDE